MTPQSLSSLYAGITGIEPQSCKALAGAGSNRRYYRLSAPGAVTCIGVEGTSVDENDAFLYLAHHFAEISLPVPRVLAVSHDRMSYLVSDLGDVSLFDSIANGRETGNWDDHSVSLLIKTIRLLPDIQWRGAVGLDFDRCYPVAAMDRRAVMWDLNYFKYCFLKPVGIDFSENLLEDDFAGLASRVDGSYAPTLMYRDFQSRNVMIVGDKPWFIDFQGARRGQVYYDVASFLWQARARIPAELRATLIDEYVDAASRYDHGIADGFTGRLRHFVLFRLLQVLGAYGFRGYFERKPHFIKSIPPALQSLRELLSEPFDEYPYLCDVLQRMISLPQFTAESEPLTVTVTSFSYKKALPSDSSGNGGGFVFDCRALPNPGRYERYKTLTGMDVEVIDFLKRESEVADFLDHVEALVGASVKRYVERGFTSLMVNFGCTGGRHRSVYCAENVARFVHRHFPMVRVEVRHIEQGIGKTFNPGE